MAKKGQYTEGEFHLVDGALLNELADLKARIKGALKEVSVTELPDGGLSLGLPSLTVVKLVANGRKVRAMIPIIPVQ